jgi:hypothetical protein
MHASEIAKFADIDLQDLGLGSAQTYSIGSEPFGKAVHQLTIDLKAAMRLSSKSGQL